MLSIFFYYFSLLQPDSAYVHDEETEELILNDYALSSNDSNFDELDKPVTVKEIETNPLLSEK